MHKLDIVWAQIKLNLNRPPPKKNVHLDSRRTSQAEHHLGRVLRRLASSQNGTQRHGR